MSDLVRIPIGTDLLRGEILRSACEEQGIAVQLLRNEHPETGGFSSLGSSFLLVRSEDEDAVREVVSRTP